jgi:hypothetical protein
MRAASVAGRQGVMSSIIRTLLCYVSAAGFVVVAVALSPGQLLGQHDGRYAFKYPGDFFSDGGRVLAFNPSMHRRIGILVQNRTGIPLQEIAGMVFKSSPFDSYRQFFYFRIEHEFQEDLARNNASFPRAYDYSGRAIPGGLPTTGGQGAFNMVFMKFGLKEVIQCSCSGATIHTSRGNFSYVGEDSILHETGHALAGLADEYSHPAASDFAAMNIEDRRTRRVKWSGLIEQGFLPDSRIERREIIGGIDRGQFLIPSNNCYMNNNRSPNDDRYCPVCQLAIIARISQLSGAPVPWE